MWQTLLCTAGWNNQVARFVGSSPEVLRRCSPILRQSQQLSHLCRLRDGPKAETRTSSELCANRDCCSCPGQGVPPSRRGPTRLSNGPGWACTDYCGQAGMRSAQRESAVENKVRAAQTDPESDSWKLTCQMIKVRIQTNHEQTNESPPCLIWQSEDGAMKTRRRTSLQQQRHRQAALIKTIINEQKWTHQSVRCDVSVSRLIWNTKNSLCL